MENMEELGDLVEKYYKDKQILDEYKKSVETENQKIKEIMQHFNMSEFKKNQYQAKITIQKREKFIDDKLISKLKELNITTPIKTIEIVDMDELENVIYNGQLNASELTNCKTTSEVVTLKVKELK